MAKLARSKDFSSRLFVPNGQGAYYYFLFAVFDPELVELQAELVRQSGEEPNSPVQTTIGNTFFSYVQSLILGFMMAAGIGFILSRRLPANN